MKKTLFFLSLTVLASGISSAAINLKYQYTFDHLNGQIASVTNDAVANDWCTPGSATMSNSGGYINWASSTGNSSIHGTAYAAHGGVLTLSGTNGLGVNTTEGFSISLNVMGSTTSSGVVTNAAQYSKILYLTDSSNKTFYLQKDTDRAGETGGWAAYNKPTHNNIGNWASASINSTSMTNIILTFQGTTVHVYQDGVLKISADNLDLSDISSLKLTDSSNNITFDELQIYSGVLNASEIARLAADPTTPVPEPTTATLSFLALAGLMARRRRVA